MAHRDHPTVDGGVCTAADLCSSCRAMAEHERIAARQTNWIGCAVCLNLTGQRVPAEFIAGGLSVCEKHVELASHKNIWDIIRDNPRIKGAT